MAESNMTQIAATDDVGAQSSGQNEPRNEWTYIFARATEHFLWDYKSKVTITTEYRLYQLPMRIDIVVVKLLEDFVIENTVMRFFKKHNIIEFKGPGDYLNIQAFDRVMSYFYAYLSTNDERPDFKDVTITFVSVSKPRKLMDELCGGRKYKIIRAEEPGIYYIKGDGSVPAMQLVVNSELAAADTEWLKAIRDDWTPEYGAKMVEAYKKSNKDAALNETMYLLWKANKDIWKEVEKMMATEQEVREYFDGWAVRSGTAEKWMRKKSMDVARKMIAADEPVEKIVEFTGLLVDDVLRLQSEGL